MRLICGIIRLDGNPADPRVLAAMIAALTQPGLTPAVAQRIDGPAGLAVLDFAGDIAEPSELPLGPDGIWLAADLRLDRPDELAATLGCPPHESALGLTQAALQRWGDDLPDRMDGDFALAAWEPHSQRLHLARDFMGIRPLCYTYQPGQLFAFASFPKGLHHWGLGGPGLVTPRPNMLALGLLPIQSYNVGPATVYQDISWVQPGQSLILNKNELRFHQAFRYDPAEIGRYRGSAEQAAATLRELLQQAVASRVPAQGPLATHLSGGLDSSGITVLAARLMRQSGRRLHAFSQVARPHPTLTLTDETPFIEAVLAQEPDIIWAPDYLAGPVDYDFIEPDLPEAGYLYAPEDRVCAAAAAAGASLILSGAGGDECTTIHAGGIHSAFLTQFRWRSLIRELPKRARLDGRSLGRTFLRRVLGPLQPGWLAAWRDRARGRPSPTDPLAVLDNLVPDFADAIRQTNPLDPPFRHRGADRIWYATATAGTTARCTMWTTIAARHGLAFSFPLLDRRVVDFVMSLPLDHLAADGYLRQPYRNAMTGILPEKIRLRESKYAPYPDRFFHFAAAKPALLQRVQRLRRNPAVTRYFNLDQMAAALATLPSPAEAEAASVQANTDAPGRYNPRRPVGALRLLILAEHVARLLPVPAA